MLLLDFIRGVWRVAKMSTAAWDAIKGLRHLYQCLYHREGLCVVRTRVMECIARHFQNGQTTRVQK